MITAQKKGRGPNERIKREREERGDSLEQTHKKLRDKKRWIFLKQKTQDFFKNKEALMTSTIVVRPITSIMQHNMQKTKDLRNLI